MIVCLFVCLFASFTSAQSIDLCCCISVCVVFVCCLFFIVVIFYSFFPPNQLILEHRHQVLCIGNKALYNKTNKRLQEHITIIFDCIFFCQLKNMIG